MSTPGPKPGRAAQIKADLANYKDEAACLREVYLRAMASQGLLARRIETFNELSLLAKLLFILKGGHV
jgi:hypothetical protein